MPRDREGRGPPRGRIRQRAVAERFGCRSTPRSLTMKHLADGLHAATSATPTAPRLRGIVPVGVYREANDPHNEETRRGRSHSTPRIGPSRPPAIADPTTTALRQRRAPLRSPRGTRRTFPLLRMASCAASNPRTSTRESRIVELIVQIEQLPGRLSGVALFRDPANCLDVLLRHRPQFPPVPLPSLSSGAVGVVRSRSTLRKRCPGLRPTVRNGPSRFKASPRPRTSRIPRLGVSVPHPPTSPSNSPRHRTQRQGRLDIDRPVDYSSATANGETGELVIRPAPDRRSNRRRDDAGSAKPARRAPAPLGGCLVADRRPLVSSRQTKSSAVGDLLLEPRQLRS